MPNTTKQTQQLVIIIITALTLSSCTFFEPDYPISNDEIIAETKKCTDAGLNAQELTNMAGVIKAIQCELKENK